MYSSFLFVLSFCFLKNCCFLVFFFFQNLIHFFSVCLWIGELAGVDSLLPVVLCPLLPPVGTRDQPQSSGLAAITFTLSRLASLYFPLYGDGSTLCDPV